MEGEEGFWDEEGEGDVFQGFEECVVGEGDQMGCSGDVVLVLSSSDFHAKFCVSPFRDGSRLWFGWVGVCAWTVVWGVSGSSLFVLLSLS